MLRAQKPRVHSTLEANRPILIFTDGAYEDGVATAGAVVVDVSQRHAYVVTVPDELVKLWNRVAGDQIISQVKLWALVSVKLCLRKQLLGRRVIEWIDNESARMSAIKANSPLVSMRILARVLADLEHFNGLVTHGQKQSAPFQTLQTCLQETKCRRPSNDTTFWTKACLMHLMP